MRLQAFFGPPSYSRMDVAYEAARLASESPQFDSPNCTAIKEFSFLLPDFPLIEFNLSCNT